MPGRGIPSATIVRCINGYFLKATFHGGKLIRHTRTPRDTPVFSGCPGVVTSSMARILQNLKTPSRLPFKFPKEWLNGCSLNIHKSWLIAIFPLYPCRVLPSCAHTPLLCHSVDAVAAHGGAGRVRLGLGHQLAGAILEESRHGHFAVRIHLLADAACHWKVTTFKTITYNSYQDLKEVMPDLSQEKAITVNCHFTQEEME